jgi:hypothetical protein
VLHAFDAAFLVAFGAATVTWSRRVFGGALPGALGWLAFLWVYLGYAANVVGQRDWFGPALAFAGIYVLETGASRGRRAASAILFAAGFAIRPHVVLFAPAAISAVFEHAPAGTEGRSRAVRDAVEWAAFAAAGVALAFLPVIVAGLVPDFLSALSLAAPGGVYAVRSRELAGGFLESLAAQLSRPKTLLFPCAALLAAWRWRSPHLRVARTWAVATAAAIVYLPLHPYPYPYLDIPLRMAVAVDAAVLAGIVLASAPWRPAAKGGAVAAILLLALPATPRHLPSLPEYCSAVDSRIALAGFVRDGEPATLPPGARPHFLPAPGQHYEWEDYRRTLSHLRTATAPSTRVAPFFRNYCFPALGGMTDRAPVFPTDQGLLWAWQLDRGYERVCVEALERTPDSVVVWAPDEVPAEPYFAMPEMEAAVRRLYVPDARFGAIEVWRRR